MFRMRQRRERGMRWISTIGLAVVVLSMSSMLSVPAALYVWQKPSITNCLSLFFTLGFFCCIFLLVRSTAALIAIGFIVLVLNLIEIVSLIHFGGRISLCGLVSILYVDPNEARAFAAEHPPTFAPGALVAVAFLGLRLLQKKL